MMGRGLTQGPVVAGVICAVLCARAFGMPPRPGLDIPDPTHAIRGMESPVLSDVTVEMTAEGLPVLSRTCPVQGTEYYPVLLIDYTDLASTYPRTNFQRELFDGPHPTGSMQDYYHEVSYGAYTVDGDAYGWYHAPYDRSYYSSGGNWGLGIGDYPNNAAGLIVAALELADPAVDFSLFDNDNDNEIDALIVIHAGEGAEGSASGYDIWSHNWELSSWTGVSAYGTDDGVIVDRYLICPEISSVVVNGMIEIGVICHEFGHALGLPDLYDTTPATWPDSDGIGNYGLMSTGSWGGDGNTPHYPVHLCAWSKKFLGWIDPTVATGDLLGTSLPPVETAGDVYMIGASSPSDTIEYFLLENRQQIGFDQSFPAGSHGLLIWHIDESVVAAGLPSNTVNGDKDHKGVDLEEADGLNHLDDWSNWNRGDAGDFYPGSTENRTFDAFSNPNSNAYGGSDTGVSVWDISEDGGLITCSVGIGTDLYEPNDSLSQAYGPINPPGEAYASYIFSEDDVDFYWFSVGAEDTIDVHLDVPPGLDYNLELWRGTVLVATSANGVGEDEDINWHVGASGDIFYVSVFGYQGSWSAQEPYSLTTTFKDITPPSLGIALLHNSFLTRYLDVWVVSDEPLASGPTTTVRLDSSETVLQMDEVVLQTYQGDYRFAEAGIATIEVGAADSAGNDTTRTRSLTIVLAPPLSGATVASSDGRWVLGIPAGAVGGEFLTAIVEDEWEARRSGPGRLAGPGERTPIGSPVRLGPEGLVLGVDATLTARFDVSELENASARYLGVYRLDGSEWRYLGGVLDPISEHVKVGIDRLGVYVLMLDGGGPEISLAARPLLLEQNYPNPFGVSTTIAYTVPPFEWTGEAPVDVSLAIYNLLGQRVATLVARPQVPGEHRCVWEGLDDGGRRVATGIYYYRLEVGGRSDSRRLVYLK